jgi:hypothetical protein
VLLTSWAPLTLWPALRRRFATGKPSHLGRSL